MRLLSSVNGKRVRGPLAAAKKELDKKQQKQAQKNQRMLLRKKQQEEQSRRRSVKGRRNAVSNINKNVVSRYEPLDYVTRRRVILDWLRDMLRDSWTSTLFISNLFFYISILTIFIFPIFLYTIYIQLLFIVYEENKQKMKSSCKTITVEEMKEIMSEDIDEEDFQIDWKNKSHNGQKLTSFERQEGLLARTLTEIPTPPFVFKLFSEIVKDIKAVIRSGHEKEIEKNRLRKAQDQLNARNVLSRETKKGRGASVSSIEGSKASSFSTTETLRKILGSDLIESIGEFVRNGQTS